MPVSNTMCLCVTLLVYYLKRLTWSCRPSIMVLPQLTWSLQHLVSSSHLRPLSVCVSVYILDCLCVKLYRSLHSLLFPPIMVCTALTPSSCAFRLAVTAVSPPAYRNTLLSYLPVAQRIRSTALFSWASEVSLFTCVVCALNTLHTDVVRYMHYLYKPGPKIYEAVFESCIQLIHSKSLKRLTELNL